MEPSSDVGSQQNNMRLREAFLRWVGCLGGFILLLVLASSLQSKLFGNAAFFGYFGAGFYLNRCVLRKLIEWHPMYNTLYNVSSAKLKFFLFWPLMYFFLFIRLGINKVL